MKWHQAFYTQWIWLVTHTYSAVVVSHDIFSETQASQHGLILKSTPIFLLFLSPWIFAVLTATRRWRFFPAAVTAAQALCGITALPTGSCALQVGRPTTCQNVLSLLQASRRFESRHVLDKCGIKCSFARAQTRLQDFLDWKEAVVHSSFHSPRHNTFASLAPCWTPAKQISTCWVAWARLELQYIAYSQTD